MIFSTSSDEDIINAIQEKGHHFFAHRDHDHPGEDERNTLCWVIPSDIGTSSRKDKSLLQRLNKMTKRGLLEKRYYGNHPRYRVVMPE